jgi:hypothetical protein
MALYACHCLVQYVWQWNLSSCGWYLSGSTAPLAASEFPTFFSFLTVPMVVYPCGETFTGDKAYSGSVPIRHPVLSVQLSPTGATPVLFLPLSLVLDVMEVCNCSSCQTDLPPSLC